MKLKSTSLNYFKHLDNLLACIQLHMVPRYCTGTKKFAVVTHHLSKKIKLTSAKPSQDRHTLNGIVLTANASVQKTSVCVWSIWLEQTGNVQGEKTWARKGPGSFMVNVITQIMGKPFQVEEKEKPKFQRQDWAYCNLGTFFRCFFQGDK